MSGFLLCKSLFKKVRSEFVVIVGEKESQGCLLGLEKDLVETEVVGCQALIWKPKFKTLGIDSLAWNNRELSEGPPCPSASWALTRLS